MAAAWMLHRLRSSFLNANQLLMVLDLLEEAALSEWEVLNLLYSRYRSAPGANEFRRLVQSLVRGGYATVELADGTRKLRISEAGLRLRRRLEDEYRAMVSTIDAASV